VALRTKTVRYALETRVLSITADTTFAASTRFNSAATTIHLPETTSRTIRSVAMVVSFNWEAAIASNLTGVRLGIKLGAVAVSDQDWTPTAQTNTGDPESVIGFTRDVTSYFVTNFGAGASQTCEWSFVAQASAAVFVGLLTCELFITYEYDDAGITAELKTVVIPLQSHHTTLTAVLQEFGTTGGTNNAPANQIPALDTFLPEASKVIRQAYFIVECNDAAAATTDFIFYFAIDSDPELVRGFREGALNGGAYYRDLIPYDTATYSTASAHAAKARGGLTGRFECCGALLVVTYEYNPTTTTRVLNSLVLPCSLGDENIYVQATTTADAEDVGQALWIEDAGTITLKQSGVQIRGNAPAGATFRMWAGAQAERSYTLANLTNSGGSSVIHRIDHNSSITLVRGNNNCSARQYTTAATTFSVQYGVIYLNYESDIATEGGSPAAFRGSHSTYWLLEQAAPTSGAQPTITTISSGMRTPVIPESSYRLLNVGYQFEGRVGATNALVLQFANQSGEFNSYGWTHAIPTVYVVLDAELGTYGATHVVTEFFNYRPTITGRANIETARNYRLRTVTATYRMGTGVWVTWHAYRYAATGNVTGSSGGTVTLLAYDAVLNELTGETNRSGDGSYTALVDTNVNPTFVSAREDSTHLGRSDNATATLT
jgi:hypothetical protein